MLIKRLLQNILAGWCLFFYPNMTEQIVSGQEPPPVHQDLAHQDSASSSPSTWFGLRAVDAETGEGVPLVRFKTTSHLTLWSDSHGHVAFDEPGLMDTEVHFEIDSSGYTLAADGFGFRGKRVTPRAGQMIEIELDRINLAQRVRRLTGQGIYRETERLGLPVPLGTPPLNAGVTGSDSVQMVPYRGRLFWLWGDTNLAHYPLGNFHVTAATSPWSSDKELPPPASAPQDASPVDGGGATPGEIAPESAARETPAEVSLQYFKDAETGRVKKMCPLDRPGAVWLFGLIPLPDPTDPANEILVAHYSRHLRLGEMVEQGIVVYDDTNEQFRVVATIDLEHVWQVPTGQAFRHMDDDGDFVYFANPFPVVRVPANLAAVCDPQQYQAYAWDAIAGAYAWQTDQPPISQTAEQEKIQQQQLPTESARFQVRDHQTQRPVMLHRASVNWNAYRQRWIMIGNEIDPTGSPSLLGEVWYAEARELTGPWQSAIKIATHPGYSFYNPRQHVVWDELGGRVIYFEGTYTQMFSGTQTPVPHYEYNQLLYRLDLESVIGVNQ